MTINITSKGWLAIGFMAVILICMFVGFRGCDKTPEVAKKPDPVRLIDSLKIDSLEKRIAELQRKDSVSKVSIAEKEDQLKSNEVLMNRANRELRKFIAKAQASGDTTVSRKLVDSLAYAATVAIESSVEFQSSTSEVIEAWHADSRVCQQEIEAQRQRGDSFKAAFESEFKARQELNKDYNDLKDKYNKVLKGKKQGRAVIRVLSGSLLATLIALAASR